MAITSLLRPWRRPTWSVLPLLISLFSGATGLQMTYCSDQNTGSDFSKVYDMYQSNGACQGTCSGYSFAILQGSYCWCSNDVPSSTVDESGCQIQCPGYTEWCGNVQDNLYAYFALGPPPSGTVGASGSTSTSTATYPVTASATQSASEPVATSSTSTGSSNSQTTSSAAVQTSLTTVTGQVRTIYITPTSNPDSSPGSGQSSAKAGHSGVSGGTVAGIVVGVAVGLGLIIGASVWFWLRHRQRGDYEQASVSGSSPRGRRSGVPSRQVSQMSSAGLLGRVPRITTNGLSSGSGPKSAESSNLDRRSLGTDQRLNPYAIYAHEESRLSNVSLQDNQDYSRQLRVANPDP